MEQTPADTPADTWASAATDLVQDAPFPCCFLFVDPDGVLHLIAQAGLDGLQLVGLLEGAKFATLRDFEGLLYQRNAP